MDVNRNEVSIPHFVSFSFSVDLLHRSLSSSSSPLCFTSPLFRFALSISHFLDSLSFLPRLTTLVSLLAPSLSRPSPPLRHSFSTLLKPILCRGGHWSQS
ncbi:hypothetical protein Scep_014573 [Stephania cephalantha]|uniref:Uncharacterized protein n=1 Tax=Stephania cephalantha TaxID=152367 RepID=A0AAP0J188_9MAGN